MRQGDCIAYYFLQDRNSQKFLTAENAENRQGFELLSNLYR